ncbi:MAG: flagellar hook-associated protein FlgK [Burkholderiaceae bacterium]|nr:flagellar hook-associated protein FlgK [Burkholderiaceae bacterium]
MGTGNLMSIGMRAMAANFAALQTTGHNIANASVEGYSRQQVELQTASGQFTGAGFFGKGVDVAAVTRSHDEFLTREAAAAKSQSAGDQARFEQLSRLEQVFPPGEQGLGYAAGQLLNAMVDLASRPQDSSTREVVLARAQDVASRFAAAGAQLDSLQNGVTQDLQNGIAAVNQLTGRIADVNEQIARLAGVGQPANDLLDQREKLVSDLSAYVQVTTIPASDGTLGIFMAGGQRLVLGKEALQLVSMTDAFDASRQAVGIVDNGVTRALPQELVGTGSLGGLLRFQNEDLASARNQLGQMATALATRLNQQQALGLDLRTPPGRGAPLFALGAPRALPATTNGRDLAGNFLASVTMTVTDASQLQPSEYELRSDPASAGRYLLTRRSDGLQRSIASGDTVDGLTVTVGVPAPAAGDRFLLQAVTRGANGLRRVLADPRGLAAASPLEAVRDVANTGTATVGALAVVNASVNPQHTASIAFTNASGAYTWALRDRTSNALVASGTGTWTPGAPITLNGFELRLDGVPAAGDSFTVAKTAYPEASNGNALALVALRDERMVSGQNITDAYASVMAGVGVRVQGARTSAEISQAVAGGAEERRNSRAGVNLDEEAARLMQFQQSYQAAAKVLQVAQSLFQTLLETAR